MVKTPTRALASVHPCPLSITKVSLFLSFFCNPIGLFCVYACHQPWLDLQGFPKLGSWYLEVGSCLEVDFSLSSLTFFGFTPPAPVSDMDLLQFLVSFFVLLLSGSEVTGTQKTTLDPSLKICISLGIGWDE